MSSLLKVISLVSCRKALSALISTARHSTLAPEAMLTKASVAILHLLAEFQLIKQVLEPRIFLQGGNGCDK